MGKRNEGRRNGSSHFTSRIEPAEPRLVLKWKEAQKHILDLQEGVVNVHFYAPQKQAASNK